MRSGAETGNASPCIAVLAVLAVLVALSGACGTTVAPGPKPACTPETADCNRDPSDGCEVLLDRDPAHCGSCDVACVAPFAQASCVAGQCAYACDPGRLDCNGDMTDGCEVAVDDAHCGACDRQCASDETCAGGTCIACPAHMADCNGDTSDGCEVDLWSDRDHCGTCEEACADPHWPHFRCDMGTCNPCCEGLNWADCGDCDCVFTLGNVDDCNGCGIVCAVDHGTPACGETCEIGGCDPGFADCDGLYSTGCETSLETDEGHCGACGTPCGESQSCVGGACQ